MPTQRLSMRRIKQLLTMRFGTGVCFGAQKGLWLRIPVILNV